MELRAGEAKLLGEMLHALGQPLTVLGGCRLMAQMPEMASAELMEEMAGQVERATVLYGAMRLLLEGSREMVGLREVEAEWRRRAGARGVRLRVEGLRGGVEERVIEGVLGAGLRSCADGEELRVGMGEDWMEVVGGGELGVEAPWELRVAEVVTEGRVEGGSDGAGVVYRLQPFHARVRLRPV